MEDDFITLYHEQLVKTNFDLKAISRLELTQFLENVLLPKWTYDRSAKLRLGKEAAKADAKAPQAGDSVPYEHVMCIVLMINEKLRERVPTWSTFRKQVHVFAPVFHAATTLIQEAERFAISYRERVALLTFIRHAFTSVEVDFVRSEVQRYASITMWHSLSELRLEAQLARNAKYRRIWSALRRAAAQRSEEEASRRDFECNFVRNMIESFFSTLDGIRAYVDASANRSESKLSDAEYRKAVEFSERFVEFLIDIESLLPIRRFASVLLDDVHFLERCKVRLPSLRNAESGRFADDLRLLSQLLDMLEAVLLFEMDEDTGETRSATAVQREHYDLVLRLQKTAFRYHNELLEEPDESPSVKRDAALNKLKRFALSSVAAVDSVADARDTFASLPSQWLETLLGRVGLLQATEKVEHDLLVEIVVGKCCRRVSQLDAVRRISLYPTEQEIWDRHLVPDEVYAGEHALALPKLGLQFLTVHDYLLRNFTLFRLESTYEIRETLDTAVSRMRPVCAAPSDRDLELSAVSKREAVSVLFTGWSRFALPLAAFSIVEVQSPRLGHVEPRCVKADLTLALTSVRNEVRLEWDALRRHDVLLLLSVRPKAALGPNGRPEVEVACVRGCEIDGVLDDEGRVVNDEFGAAATEEQGVPQSQSKPAESGEQPNPRWKGRNRERNRDESQTAVPKANRRTRSDIRMLRVLLDPVQYAKDMEQHLAAADGKNSDDLYQTFNLVVRRKPEENNFKAVLETIRDLMATASAANERSDHDSSQGQSLVPSAVVPVWLQDVVLGYGEPSAASYFHASRHDEYIAAQNWYDTFLDEAHLRDAFPQHDIRIVANNDEEDDVTESDTDDSKLRHEYRLTVPFPSPSTDEQKQSDNAPERPVIVAEARRVAASSNTVRYTPTQVEAIRSGMQRGLTMIVGPPGSGKTDTAVQIVANVYRNYPQERILIVTHSNAALNQLFDKIVQLHVGIDERHLLRLGHGEEALQTEKDFSKTGRVNYVLGERVRLLELVRALAVAMDCPVDHAYTCESAGHFFTQHVVPTWYAFVERCRLQHDNAAQDATFVRQNFPFGKFFEPQLRGADQHDLRVRFFDDFRRDFRAAKRAFERIRSVFDVLEEYRAFEMLRTPAERANYLLVKEARIIAMTCTHAALKRRDLLECGLRYDTVVFEEAAQILEVETFIPALLQADTTRLKRLVLLGDHNQLPPVIRNLAFQRYANLEQSMFARLVRLGVPAVELDAQGRARASIARLYAWRYRRLANMAHVDARPEFIRANPGFLFETQLIDVGDFDGVGESEPMPHFVQNLAEAEYAVAIYMYMRLLDYPADRITILTTYNGQKHLIRDVLAHRCAGNSLFGWPSLVTTVDKFQGSQNDFVILSLVRTRLVGHLRDVRRLVVAMSRARLGLYVLARVSLFSRCYELSPVFSQLLRTPTQLQLLPAERYDSCARRAAENSEALAKRALTIGSMPDMLNFVGDFYSKRIDELMVIAKDRERERLEADERAKAQQEAEAQKLTEVIAAEPQTEEENQADKPGTMIVNEIDESAEEQKRRQVKRKQREEPSDDASTKAKEAKTT